MCACICAHRRWALLPKLSRSPQSSRPLLPVGVACVGGLPPHVLPIAVHGAPTPQASCMCCCLLCIVCRHHTPLASLPALAVRLAGGWWLVAAVTSQWNHPCSSSLSPPLPHLSCRFVGIMHDCARLERRCLQVYGLLLLLLLQAAHPTPCATLVRAGPWGTSGHWP
jgi:hypothetical protein